MNLSTPPPDDSWESDAVWKLLDQAPPLPSRASFADEIVRMAKLLPVSEPWWKRLFTPAPITAFAAFAAAVGLAFTFFGQPKSGTAGTLATTEPTAQTDPFAAIQEIAETETLIAAADHLDDFSDQEIASMVGF